MYQKARTYKLLDASTNEMLLIGSTTIRLCAELQSNHGHSKMPKKYKAKYDRISIDAIGIELIESLPCNNIDE